ncbi:MAG: MBL fold metallo-hydrolase [Desulfobacteraceae bacterium]|jgi:7,8-dihydropterin-6-yl-methyl-4-(beta-D-ribofuranosyl)aminobenzene 5'-phosphate synthase
MNHLPDTLKEVDRVEIVTLIDNYVDVLLKDTDIVTRPPRRAGEEIPTDTLVAEHGLSLLVTVCQREKTHTILFDTGYSQIGVPHNMALLGIDLQSIEAIVLSHAHMDHTGALHGILQRMQGPLTLVVHPGAFYYPRYIERDDGKKQRFPRTLSREDLPSEKVEILENKNAILMADNGIMVTGEVERSTGFEKGLPGALMEKDGKMKPDPISDDQALVLHVREKGLVVISGCSHSGIINTILHAQKLTGLRKVHAVLGGLHLTGPAFEPIIEKTISELKNVAPEVIIPMHCTGWKATQRLYQEFPSAFVLNSVGSKITLS